MKEPLQLTSLIVDHSTAANDPPTDVELEGMTEEERA